MTNAPQITAIALLLLAIPPGSTASAGPSDEARLRPTWEALDSNGDGRVELDEITDPRAAFMAMSDLDGDGALSLAEFVSFDLDPGGAGRRPLPAGVRLVADQPYAGSDDPRQQLDLYLPEQPGVAEPLPVIAFLHGGGWRTGSRIMARPQVLSHVVSGRYAAVSIGYRLSWQDTWPAQIHDAKAAIRWIRAHADDYGLDPARICAMGPSAGGHLAALLGTTNGVAAVEGSLGAYGGESSSVQCAVDFFGPTDLTRSRPDRGDPEGSAIQALFGARPEERPEHARAASPLLHVDADDPPFLIVHGTEDPLVAYSESVALDRALRGAGVPVVFQTIRGGGHGDFGIVHAEVLDQRVRAFLERSLYDPATPVPSGTLDFSPPSPD